MSSLNNAELFDESESNPFNVDEYIERLAWRTRASSENNFDPQLLYDEFCSHIQELRTLDDALQKKATRLESELRDEGTKHAKRIQELQRSQQTAFQSFQELEDRISTVAARVVHLGEQLEGVNTPREHAFDAQKLMGYLAEFLNGEPSSDVLVNPSRLNETADIIRKLYLIAQELPEAQFEAVRMKIFETYKSTEKSLLMKFRQASQDNNIEQMQQMAETLSRDAPVLNQPGNLVNQFLRHFNIGMLSYQHYQHCVDAFIEQAVHQLTEKGLDDDLFHQIEDLIEHVTPQITQVFNTPDQVTAKLIQSCYDEQIQQYIYFKLNPMRKSDMGLYLREAMRLYQLTTKLSEALPKYRPGGDVTFTKKLQRVVFEPFTSRKMSV